MKKNININKTLIKNIINYGRKFFKEYLENEGFNNEKLQNNWWEALRFFFAHSFYRGRSDELSNRYYHFTIEVLEDYLDIHNEFDKAYKKLMEQKAEFDIKNLKTLGRKKNIVDSNNFQKIRENNFIIKSLTSPRIIKTKKEPKPTSLRNIEDIMMVLNVLNFITEEGRENIYRYLKQKIINSKIEEVYTELVNIRAIGDKIASLIIRDIGLISREASEIIKKTPEFAFPIDTLIRNRIVPEFIEQKERKNDKEIKKFFINKCQEYFIDDILEFAAGLWYIASNSLYISLDLLSKLNND